MIPFGQDEGVKIDDAHLEDVAQAREEFQTKYNDKIDNTVDLYISRPGHIIVYFMNGHPDANEYYSNKNN